MNLYHIHMMFVQFLMNLIRRRKQPDEEPEEDEW